MTSHAHPSAGTTPVETATLPRDVLRPLYIGFVAVSAFALCFLLWAVLAPLSTSIHATGHLNASQPSFDVQHPFGGDLAEVLVTEHEHVETGQVLLRLDVASELSQKEELKESLTLLLREKEALEWALAHLQSFIEAPQQPAHGFRETCATDHPTATTCRPPGQSGQRVTNMIRVLNLRQQATEHSASAMTARANGLQNSIAVRENQRRSMQARFDRFAGLVKSGALRASEHDTLLETILDLDASILAEKAEVAALQTQARQTELQIATEVLELRQRLLDRQAQINEALPRTRMQILRLDALINAAAVRAPATGTVSRLLFDTDTMYVPRGETVLTLTRPTQTHRVSFVVPPFAIDQTRVGMEGQLTVASLPQRNHPKVRVVIQSLSPEARRNGDGAVIGYDGVAAINADDLAALRTELGEHSSLSIDMPVTLIFAGRETTFSDYLIGPFLDFRAKALQD